MADPSSSASGYSEAAQQTALGTGQIVGSFFASDAAKAIASARAAALAAQEQQNIAGINSAAQQYDTMSYLGRLGLLGEMDPNSRLAYDSSSGLMRQAMTDSHGQTDRARQALEAAYNENLQGSAGLKQTQDANSAQAAALLAQGDKLDPAMQAELVRQQLANAASSGGVLGGSNTKSRAALGLLQGQQAVAQQRQGMAQNLIAQNQNLANQRSTMLSNLSAARMGLQSGEAGFADAANQFVGSRLPSSYGISGSDAANLNVQNTNQRNANLLAAAGVTVQGINGRQAAVNQGIGGGANIGSGISKAVATYATGGAAASV